MPAIHNKRLVTVTLDIMCYDDLDLEDLNWRELLQLDSGEDINVSVKEFDLDWQCASLEIGLILNNQSLIDSQLEDLIENEDSWRTGTRPLDICHVMGYV